MSTGRAFPVPGEQRLAALIAEAFDALPAPEQTHLSEVLDRVVRATPRRAPVRRRTRLAWWVVALALAGAGASALWMNARQRAPVETQVSPEAAARASARARHEPSSDGTRSGAVDREQQERIDANDKRTQSPVIYQRDTY